MKLSRPDRSQTIRFSILLAASFVICTIWFLPFYESQATEVQLLHQFINYYVFSTIVLLSILVGGIAYSLYALFNNKFVLLQSRRSLLTLIIVCWLFALVTIFVPQNVLQPLQYRAVSIATFVTGMLGLLFLYHRSNANKYLQVAFLVYLTIAIGYCSLEVASAHFITQQPIIEHYFEWRYPVHPASVATSECLKGCIEHPEWITAGTGANVYRNSQVRWYHPSRYDVIHTYNNMGLRGPDTTYASDKYRIMILGDSYVNGLDLNNEETIGLQLQSLLDDIPDGNSTYEVLQLGIYGCSEISAYTYYKSEGYKFDPDLILYQ